MSGKRVVIRSHVMGFCMGVKAVMQKVEEEIKANKDSALFTYGPLIHNRLVIDKLHERGVGEIESPEEADGGTIIIRAHGIHPAVRADFAKAGYRIIEGTCPRVLKSQQTVSRYSAAGWHVIIVGDRNHGEVRAIEGCADSCSVVLTEDRAHQIDVPDKTLVIAQTTLSKEEYDNICRILYAKNPDIKIVKSICPATRQRQVSLKDLIEKVEAVIVVGGKNSANTRRLYLRAKKTGKPSWHVEDVEELPDELKKYKRIGITAGASTPDWIIDDIERAVMEM